MKIISIIFTMYILLSAGFPCCDVNDDDSSNKVSYELVEHDHSEDSDCEENGCSPFSNCTCCHTNISISEISRFQGKLHKASGTTLIKTFVEFYSTPHYNTLFRPPIS